MSFALYYLLSAWESISILMGLMVYYMKQNAALSEPILSHQSTFAVSLLTLYVIDPWASCKFKRIALFELCASAMVCLGYHYIPSTPPDTALDTPSFVQ